MSSRKQVLTAGALGLLVALAAITGMVLLLPSNTSLQTGTGNTNATTGNTNSNAETTTIQTSSSATGLEGSQGQLDVLLTDPPSVPNGVTGVYVTYTNVAVHVSGAGNQTGWTNSNTSGTLDLMKLVNVSTTIAAVKVATGFYNALRFNISSAEVAYDGNNYTAFVPKAEIIVVIPGGIQVNATESSAALIDMSPTVLNIGSSSDPEFVINVSTTCMNIPPAVFVKGMDNWGYVFPMGGLNWWTQVREQYTANIRITAATLANGSLSVTVQNVGTQNISLSIISLAPLGSECSPVNSTYPETSNGQRGSQGGGPRWLPMCFTGSAFFVVLANGTLRPEVSLMGGSVPGMHGATPMDVFGDFGYALMAGQSVTLNYTGPVSFGFAFRGQAPPGVISGDQYGITAIGLQALARYTVVAS